MSESSEVKSETEGENQQSFGQCMICLEKLYKGEHRMFLPCSHHFHDLCIRPWLKKNTVCPICKVSVYVHIDEKNPSKIPEEFLNPKDSRTMSEVMRERQEQADILDTIQGRAPGGLRVPNMTDHLLQNMLNGMLGVPPGGPAAPGMFIYGREGLQMGLMNVPGDDHHEPNDVPDLVDIDEPPPLIDAEPAHDDVFLQILHQALVMVSAYVPVPADVDPVPVPDEDDIPEIDPEE
jgi:hypothetical protein